MKTMNGTSENQMKTVKTYHILDDFDEVIRVQDHKPSHDRYTVTYKRVLTRREQVLEMLRNSEECLF